MYEDVFLNLPNDKERMAFLDNYTHTGDWYLAEALRTYGRRFWAYPGDGYTIFVEDELQTVHWPKTAQKWISKSYYLVDGERDDRPFSDYRMSRSQIVNWVKERRREDE